MLFSANGSGHSDTVAVAVAIVTIAIKAARMRGVMDAAGSLRLIANAIVTPPRTRLLRQRRGSPVRPFRGRVLTCTESSTALVHCVTDNRAHGDKNARVTIAVGRTYEWNLPRLLESHARPLGSDLGTCETRHTRAQRKFILQCSRTSQRFSVWRLRAVFGHKYRNVGGPNGWTGHIRLGADHSVFQHDDHSAGQSIPIAQLAKFRCGLAGDRQFCPAQCELDRGQSHSWPDGEPDLRPSQR